jgi:hypothetical protein
MEKSSQWFEKKMKKLWDMRMAAVIKVIEYETNMCEKVLAGGSMAASVNPALGTFGSIHCGLKYEEWQAWKDSVMDEAKSRLPELRKRMNRLAAMSNPWA